MLPQGVGRASFVPKGSGQDLATTPTRTRGDDHGSCLTCFPHRCKLRCTYLRLGATYPSLGGLAFRSLPTARWVRQRAEEGRPTFDF